MGPTDRVVILIDMDCFYCQVEEKLNPKLKGQPIAVVQYNAWRGGGIIAVNYPAREQGVTRHMRGNDAKKKCPSINLVRVPEVRGKADLTKYRDAGKEVADVLATFTPLLERASVDEAYLDITELVENKIASDLDDLSSSNLKNTFVVGYELKEFLDNAKTNKEFTEDNLKLAVGGLITEKIRKEVYDKTGYRCSAGVAHNKILAKLVCSLHKPNKQTILPHEAVDNFFKTMPINKIKSLGGKFGQTLSEDLQITYMGQLKEFSEKELAQKYDEKTANWLYNVARGIDLEPVTTKLVSKSIACCKNFSGRTALTTSESVQHWLNELADELSERLEKDFKENNRRAKQMVISFSQEINKKDISSSRTHQLTSYDPRKIGRSAFEVIKKFCLRTDGSYHLKFLGLSAGHFEDVKKVREITSFFKTEQSKAENEKTVSNSKLTDDVIQTNTKTVDENTDPIDRGETDNVYLQLTQELDENIDDLIFYDDSYRIKDKQELDQAMGTKNEVKFFESNNFSKNTCSANGSISSFFKQYFDQGKDDGSSLETKKENSVLQPLSDTVKLIDDNREMSFDEESSICPECNKNIPLSEFMSHKDYHFALSLMENGAKTQPSNSSINISSSQKRKAQKISHKKVDNKNNLMSFFNISTVNDLEPSEACSECNKKIKIEDFSNHMDYHVAKRIHLELNAAGSAEKTNKSKNIPKNKAQKNIRPVTAFFKRV